MSDAIGQKAATAERECSTTHRRAAPMRASLRATIIAGDVQAAASASWKAYSEDRMTSPTVTGATR
jgi:hypothetical protein